VDQVEVDVVQAEVGEGAREGRFDGLAGTARGFGGDEELGAGDGGAGDGGAEFALVAVGWFWWRRLGTGEEEGEGVEGAYTRRRRGGSSRF
jgi:hypothetical protein